jgi:hypothetical protein
MELENVPCPLSTGENYIHYSLMGEMRLSFIDSDCYLGVPFKAGLTMYFTSMSQVLEEILRIEKKN